MAKPIEQLKSKWVFPLIKPETHPCGCCKSRINPETEAHIERYDTLYCDRVCLVTAIGAEFIGDGLDVEMEGTFYTIKKFMQEVEAREYG